MKKKREKVVLLFACMFILLSCFREEPPFTRQHREQLFCYTDARLKPVVSTMYAIDAYKPFMDEFCATYGVPLWDEADIYREAEGEAIYFWVPLYRSDISGEIRTVWFFELHNDLLTYGPVSRDSEFVRKYGQEGQFDYLSYRVFGKDNAARMVFRENPATRVYEVIGCECRDAYVVIELNGVEYAEYKGTTCKLIKVWKDYADLSFVDNDDDGGGALGGSGAGVPVVGSDLKDIAPKANAIFKHPTMLAQNWIVLEKMLDKITENCMGNALYNLLNTMLDGSKIEIKFREGNVAGFNYSSNQLLLPIGKVESNVLLHELFHALQYRVQQESAFKQSSLNNEIEAHYAQYVYLKSLPEYKGSQWERDVLYSARGKAMIALERQFSHEHIDKDAMLDTFIRYTLRAVFSAEKGYENYIFDESKEGMENLSLFNELSKDCN